MGKSMTRIAWYCDFCGRIWDKEEEAQKCEKAHSVSRVWICKNCKKEHITLSDMLGCCDEGLED